MPTAAIVVRRALFPYLLAAVLIGICNWIFLGLHLPQGPYTPSVVPDAIVIDALACAGVLLLLARPRFLIGRVSFDAKGVTDSASSADMSIYPWSEIETIAIMRGTLAAVITISFKPSLTRNTIVIRGMKVAVEAERAIHHLHADTRSQVIMPFDWQHPLTISPPMVVANPAFARESVMPPIAGTSGISHLSQSPATVLRRVTRADRRFPQGYAQAALWAMVAVALIWCGVLVYRILREPHAIDHSGVQISFLYGIVVLFVAGIAWLQMRRLEAASHQRLYILDDKIVLNESRVEDGGERTLWTISRPELMRVVPHPSGGMWFAILTAATLQRQAFLSSKQTGPLLRARDWIDTARPSSLARSAPLAMLGTKKRLIASMLATDLGQAFSKHGLL